MGVPLQFCFDLKVNRVEKDSVFLNRGRKTGSVVGKTGSVVGKQEEWLEKEEEWLEKRSRVLS